MNFTKEMMAGLPATEILSRALTLMEDEMKRSEDSLSLAMYEYAGTIDQDLMNHINTIGEKKWTDLIEYMTRGRFVCHARYFTARSTIILPSPNTRLN